MTSVLVVDDDLLMVRTLCDLLGMSGFDATGVYSAEEALAELEERAFDRVLMDIKMRGIDGLAAARAVRRHHPDTRVVLMTASTSHELIADAMRNGALEMIPPPCEVDAAVGFATQTAAEGGPILFADGDEARLGVLRERLVHALGPVLNASNVDDAVELLQRGGTTPILLSRWIELEEQQGAILAVRRVVPGSLLVLCAGGATLPDEPTVVLPPGWIHGYLRKPFQPEQLLACLA